MASRTVELTITANISYPDELDIPSQVECLCLFPSLLGNMVKTYETDLVVRSYNIEVKTVDINTLPPNGQEH